jgi:hypothetical protein
MIGLNQSRKLAVGGIATVLMVFFSLTIGACDPDHDPRHDSAINLSTSATSTYQGFMKFVYSFRVPNQPVGMTALTGSVSTATTTLPQYPYSPSEALFIVGYLPSGDCLPNGSKFTDYASLFTAMPGAVLTASFIVKNLGGGDSIASTKVDFPYPVAIAPSGAKAACVFIILDGGPSLGYISPIASITMVSAMRLQDGSKYSNPAAEIVGGGDEVCFGRTTGCQAATTIHGASFASVTRIPQGGKAVSLYGNFSDYRLNQVGSSVSAENAWLIDAGCSHFTEAMTRNLYGPDDYFGIFANTPKLYDRTDSFYGDGLEFTVDKTADLPAVNEGDCYVHLVAVDGAGEVDAESQVKLEIQP